MLTARSWRGWPPLGLRPLRPLLPLNCVWICLAQLLNITDDYMTLMSDNGDIREDLRVPDNEVGKEIMTKFQANEEFYVSPAPLFRLCPFRHFRKKFNWREVASGVIETESELFGLHKRRIRVHVKFCIILSGRSFGDYLGPHLMSFAGLCNVCHGGGVCHRYQDHGKQIKEMDFAAQATSSSHNQSLAFSLALPPKRQPSDDLILLWFLSSWSFPPPSPSRFSFPSRWFPRPDRRLVWSSYKRLQINDQLLTLPCWFATHIPEC